LIICFTSGFNLIVCFTSGRIVFILSMYIPIKTTHWFYGQMEYHIWNDEKQTIKLIPDVKQTIKLIPDVKQLN
jgi:hypothetical protein